MSSKAQMNIKSFSVDKNLDNLWRFHREKQYGAEEENTKNAFFRRFSLTKADYNHEVKRQL